MKRSSLLLGAVCGASVGAGAVLAACGGGDNSATPLDASIDAPTGADTSMGDTAMPPSDAGGDTSDAGVQCVPKDVSGFSVPPYVPATGQHQNMCTFNGAVTTFWTDCLGDAATPATCAGYRDAGSSYVACADCLETSGSASKYGPVVDAYGAKDLNLAGCVQLAVNTDAGYGCAQSIQGAARCTEYACKSNCPISDQASRSAYRACEKQAAAAGCAPFVASATSCLAQLADAGGGSIGTCVQGATDYDKFVAYGNFFCAS